MTLKIEKNRKYTIPNKRQKEIERIFHEMLAERERIEQMTQEEYDEYMIAELKKCDEEIENEELYDFEEVMKEIDEELKADERERRNAKKIRELMRRKRTYAV